MKITYTGQIYGVFGGLLNMNESVTIDLFKDNFKVSPGSNNDYIFEVIAKGFTTRFKKDTVKISITEK